MKGPDGKLFFDPHSETEELRIGVNIGIDWYYYLPLIPLIYSIILMYNY